MSSLLLLSVMNNLCEIPKHTFAHTKNVLLPLLLSKMNDLKKITHSHIHKLVTHTHKSINSSATTVFARHDCPYSLLLSLDSSDRDEWN